MQHSVNKVATSLATVRRAMTQRATRPVTLATLTCRASKSRDFVAGVTLVSVVTCEEAKA